jgi:hypothetical protein
VSCACSLQSDLGLCFSKNGRFAISFRRTSRRSGLRVWSGRNLQRFHGSCLEHHRNAAGALIDQTRQRTAVFDRFYPSQLASRHACDSQSDIFGTTLVLIFSVPGAG